jgi:hypothetical protein
MCGLWAAVFRLCGPAGLEWPAKARLAQPAQMPAHKRGGGAVRVSPNPQPPLEPAAAWLSPTVMVSAPLAFTVRPTGVLRMQILGLPLLLCHSPSFFSSCCVHYVPSSVGWCRRPMPAFKGWRRGAPARWGSMCHGGCWGGGCR